MNEDIFQVAPRHLIQKNISDYGGFERFEFQWFVASQFSCAETLHRTLSADYDGGTC